MATVPMRYARLKRLMIPHKKNISKSAPVSKSLYVSHFISTWNSRGFEFGAILFLSTIYPGTLLPMSVYALVRALAAIILSPAVGRYMDSGNRLAVVRTSILGQRLAVATSCGGLLALLLWKDSMPQAAVVAIFVALDIMACIEKLCIIMNTIAVERDWVVVVAADDDGILQQMNSQMRRIDLFCKLVSPLAIALLDGLSSKIAIIATLGVNSTSILAEYFLIAWVYTKTPALSCPRTKHSRETSDDQAACDGASTVIHRTIITVSHQIKIYAKSHAFLPSLSLALLYLTVLSFAGQMITYLFAIDYPRLTSIYVGILRTISTCLEISSTFIAPILISRLGAVRAGMWSLCFQTFCLTPGVATFWLSTPSPVFSIYPLYHECSPIPGWSLVLDLTAQLLVQNSVDASQRGSFSATESSMQNLFELCTFAMTIIWSKPEQFKYPATISLAALYVAAACYARYVRVERGHLLHLSICCGSIPMYKALSTVEEGEELETMTSRQTG